MAVLSFSPETSAKPQQPPKRRRKPPAPQQKPPSSWDQIKSLLSCKQIQGSRVHDPSKSYGARRDAAYSKLGSSCSSICSFRDVVHGNARVVHRADISPESSELGPENGLLNRKSRALPGSRQLPGGASMHAAAGGRVMPLRRLSGCYECHMIVDPARYPFSPRATICACSECGEVFPKVESLEAHQATRHAVSELGPEDSGRNIVEIIFKSSWLKTDSSICKIERILKVRNTQRTIQRFEDCRDAVKGRAATAAKRNPRCAADGNELLRFHCTTLSCALGSRGSSSLCAAAAAGACAVCTIIRHGFQTKGVRTTASSGRAHDTLGLGLGSGKAHEGRRAMLVCRVIAGRVRRVEKDAPLPEDESACGGGSYDSVAGAVGAYSNLEDLLVFNPRAILPCFVVIYKALEL